MVNGDDLRRKRYVERKSALRKLLRHDRGIQYVEHAEGHGDKLFAAACKLGLGDRFKEARRALSLGSVENLDQDQEPESACGNSRLVPLSATHAPVNQANTRMGKNQKKEPLL